MKVDTSCSIRPSSFHLAFEHIQFRFYTILYLLKNICSLLLSIVFLKVSKLNDIIHQNCIENLRQKLSTDFMNQQAALTQQLQDSVQQYLSEMNADGHYHLILNDAVLMNKVAGYDITNDVIEALNARYQQ